MTADRPAVPQDAVPPRKFDGGSSKTGVENLGTAGPSGWRKLPAVPQDAPTPCYCAETSTDQARRTLAAVQSIADEKVVVPRCRCRNCRLIRALAAAGSPAGGDDAA